MNQYEISKLKKQLLRKNEVIKEMKEDLNYVENQLVSVQAERDKYHGQLQIARHTIENVDQIIDQKVRDMKTKLQHQNSTSLNQLQTLRDRLIEEKNLNEKLNQQIRNKDAVISQLSLRLRQMSIKYKDPSLQINVKEISQQASITYNQFYKLTEKYNRLSENMENIMAENKILRKLHGVPDNFGFDLEEIKIAEKQELEDYKAQCRKLQTQIQQLQAQRTQLRYRLRQYNTLYSNKGERYKDLSQRQLQLLDAYALNLKQGKDQLPEIDKSQKQMQRQIIRLRAQVQVLQSKNPMNFITPGSKPQSNNQLSKDSMKKMQEQFKAILEPFVQDIKKLSETNINYLIQNFQNIQGSTNNTTINQAPQGVSNLRPPIPLPLANNDWSSIKEGYSYRYASKIPVDLKQYEGDIGFDTIRSKYEIAALQLQNIESLKMLKERQDQQKLIRGQLNDLKQKFKKCLLVQDQLFIKYFKVRDQLKQSSKKSQLQKRKINDQKDSLKVQVETLRQALHAFAAKTETERKLKQFAERLAKSEAGVIKSERKYEIIFDEHKFLRDSYTKMELKAAKNQIHLKQKYLNARRNQKQLTLLMNQILQQTKNSVSSDTHNLLLAKMQTLNDKSANYAFKEADLRLKISRLENIEREMDLKDQVIEYLREDKLDILLQLQIVKNRLKGIDGTYKQAIVILDRLVGFINTNNISLLQCFKKFDRDNSGKLTKSQLKSALDAFNFSLTNQQYELLFNQFDLDGSGCVNYYEFVRKIKRSGGISRTKDQQAIYLFFKAVKSSKISIKRAFQIVDRDGSGSVSKTQMETAFRQLGISVDNKTIDAIYRICDTDLNGMIQCSQLEHLYTQIVKETEIDQYQITPQLDWKYKFVLKLEQSSLKNSMTLHQTFKTLDQDGNNYITVTQLSDFLKKIGITLQNQYLNQLVRFLDVKYDGKIQYGQLLKLLEDAKKQQRRVERLLAVQRRAQELRKQNQLAVKQSQPSKATQQNILKIRMMALETKQANLIKKNQKLCKNLANKQQQIRDLEKSINENQKQIFSLQDKYNKQRQVNITLQQKMKNYIGEVEAKKIKLQHQKIKIQNCELSTQLQTFKGLCVSLTDKNKMELMSVQKIKAELNKHYDIVKELQAENINKAELGKLVLELQYSKRNEQIVNKKYEDVCQETKTLAKQNNQLSNQSLQKQKQIVNTHLLMRQKGNLMQKTIDSLTMRILPTVTMSKIDQIIGKLRQMSISKSQLQEQNKSLRQKNFNLQLKYDHIQIQKTSIQELQKKLRNSYKDQNSTALIDITKQLSEYKMSELRAKRQFNLLKEKQEYYLRINNANTDNIKQLQGELGKWEIKFNEREEFWRKRMADQMKIVDDIQKQVQKTKQNEQKAAKYFLNKQIQQQKMQQNYQQMSEMRKTNLSQLAKPPSVYREIGKNSEKIQQLNNQIAQLTELLSEKQKQNYRLRTTLQQIVPEQKLRFSTIGSQVGGHVQTNSYILQTQLTTSQLKNNARRFINAQKDQEAFFKEQAERIAQAAQQSINTLQRIIDDKNDQLKRKERIIQDLKRDMLKSKQQDCYQIQKLNQQIRELRSKNQLTNLNQIMNKSTHKQFYQGPGAGNNQQKIKSLIQMIQQKDTDIKNWQRKYNQLFLNKSKVKTSENPHNKIIENKLKQLMQQREDEKKKYIEAENKLKEKVKNLQKLIKEKDLKFAQLNKSFLQLKQSLMKQKQELSHQDIQSNDQFIKQMNQGKSANDSKMEVMLQKAYETIQTMTKKNKQYEAQIKRMRQDAKFNKTSKR